MLNYKTVTLKSLILVGLNVVLAACAPSSEQGEVVANAEQNEISSQSLMVDRDFNFDSTSTFHLDVLMQKPEKSYLSLCHSQANNRDKIDYENCMVRVRVDDGRYSEQFKLPPHFEQLHLAIWFLDTGIPRSKGSSSEMSLILVVCWSKSDMLNVSLRAINVRFGHNLNKLIDLFVFTRIVSPV